MNSADIRDIISGLNFSGLFTVMVRDQKCPYIAKGGKEFTSKVYSVQTMQIPDEDAMRQARLMPTKQYVVPVRLLAIFLVADPDGKFQWALSDECSPLE